MSNLNIQKYKYSGFGGQAILIVLLLMAVVLSIAVYRVSTSITDITISTVDEASERAFAAAEAGIEEALLIDSIVGTVDNPISIGDGADGAEYFVEFDNPDTQNLYISPPLRRGEEAFVWFVDLDANGMPTCPVGPNNCFNEPYFDFLCFASRDPSVYTGADGSDPDPAVLLTFYVSELDASNNPAWLATGDFSNVRTVTVGIDPIAARAAENGFRNDINLTGNPVCDIDGNVYKYRLWRRYFDSFVAPAHPGGFDPLGFQSGNRRIKRGYMIYMTVKVLYTADNTEEIIAINQRRGAVGKLPLQGNFFASTGTSGEATRKIRVFKAFENPLSMFLGNAVFSFGDLSK